MNKVYILKPYTPYIAAAQGEIIKYKFRLYDQWYCISEVQLEWGQPQVARPLEEDDNYGYVLYESFDDAMAYVNQLREFERYAF